MQPLTVTEKEWPFRSLGSICEAEERSIKIHGEHVKWNTTNTTPREGSLRRCLGSEPNSPCSPPTHTFILHKNTDMELEFLSFYLRLGLINL